MAEIPVRIKGAFDGSDAFDKAKKKTKELRKATKGFTATLRDLIVITTGVKRALGSMVAAVDKVNAAADRQIRAEAALSITAGKLGRDVSKTVNSFRAFSSEIQKSTRFGDEFVLELSNMALGLGKMSNDQAQDAVRAALDFSEAYGQDAKMAVVQLSRILTTGQSGLTRYGINVDETASKAEKFRQALEQLSSGTAKAFGQLPTVKMQQAKNAFGDLTESIGLLVTQSATYKVIIGRLTAGFSDLASSLRDPETVKKWIDAFDSFVTDTLRVVAEVIGGIIIGFGKIVELIENISRFGLFADWTAEAAKADAAVGKISNTLRLAKIKMQELAAEIEQTGDPTGQLSGKMRKLSAEVETLEGKLEGAKRTVASTGSDIQDMGEQVRSAIDNMATQIDTTPFESLEDFIVRIGEESKAFWKKIADGAKSTVPVISETMALVRDTIRTNLFGSDTETFQLVSEDQRALILEEASSLGSAWASLFAGSLSDGIINAESPREAFQLLGDDVRNMFIGQMSQEAFAPLRESFGLLAQTLALPFKVVGDVVNQLVIAPLMKAISSVLSSIIAGLLQVFGLQIAAQSATSAAFSETIALSIPLAIQMSSIAAAAAIATLGTALSFGPAALGTIKAVGAAGGVPFAAEGGLFMPNGSTGGQLVHVAEREPEVIVPVSKLGGGGMGALGGGGMSIEINVDNVGSGAGDISAFVDSVAEALQFRLAEAGFGGRI